MSRIPKRATIRVPSTEDDKVITTAAKNDPDAQPLTPKQLKAMVPLKTLRGRPKSKNKNASHPHGRVPLRALGQTFIP